ncbi:MAG: hypothetical protein WBL88_16840 [Nitrososphaeraceae archaeon]
MQDSSDIGEDKGSSGDDRAGSSGNNDDFSTSTILTARFGHESVKLIHLVEKNLYIVIGLIAAIAILSITNILGVLDYFSYGNVDRIVDVVLLVILIVVLLPLVVLLLRSRKVLDRWTDMFEKNTMATAMSIAMISRSKEEAVRALPQAVEQIGEPLQEYIISKKSDLKEFLNVSLDKNVVFDVLMDTNRVSSNGGNNFREILEDYGAVIINIIDSTVDSKSVESFITSLEKYISLTKNQVGLALIIGEVISREAKEYASKFSRRKGTRVNHLLLIEKPSLPLSSSTPPSQPQ